MKTCVVGLLFLVLICTGCTSSLGVSGRTHSGYAARAHMSGKEDGSEWYPVRRGYQSGFHRNDYYFDSPTLPARPKRMHRSAPAPVQAPPPAAQVEQ